MGFAKEMLRWATLNGHSVDTYWQKVLRAKKGDGGNVGEYGIEWDYSNPSPSLTRTGDAAGFSNPVPAASLAGTGSSPFDNIMPWAGMRMCNIINGEVVYWQGDPQFSETAYDTMVFIPEFWYKAEKDTENHKWRWSISPTEREGYAKHPGSGRYIGRFHATSNKVEVVLHSKSGESIVAEAPRSFFRIKSHERGSKWWMLDLPTWSALQLLYLIEFADFDAQSKIGTGHDRGTLANTGGTTGASYHTVKRSHNSNQYRWIEDPFANVYDWVDGFVASGGEAYVGTSNATFSDSVSSLANSGITFPPSGLITGFGFSSVCPWAFIPDSTSNGPYTGYVTDYFNTPSETCVLRVGGAYSASEYYGMFCFLVNLKSDNNSKFIGSRLIFIP